MTNTDFSRNVFFFGAGFSKAINAAYPTLKELTTKLCKIYDEEISFVADYWRNEINDMYKSNIETLLTYLSSTLPYKTPVQMSTDNALYKDITSRIAIYFNNELQTSKNDNCLPEVNKLMQFILDDKSICITLNYDVLLEKYLNNCALTRAKQIDFSNLYNAPLTELNPTGNISFYDINDPEPIPRDSLPDIIKLHGSINWGITADNSSIVYYIKNGDEDYRKSHLQTYIIPPVLDKTNFYSNHILKAIWQRAHNKLSNAENIYIFGFSFPETDYSIKFLFQSALKNNKTCNVYVINVENDLTELKKHYEKIFGPGKCNFDCCKNDQQIKLLTEKLYAGEK